MFDFGIRDFGYKERFSNRTIDAATVQIAAMNSARGLCAVAIQIGIDRLKLFADWWGRRNGEPPSHSASELPSERVGQ